MSERQLSLVASEPGLELKLVDGDLVADLAPAPNLVLPSPPPSAVPGLEARNLFGKAARIAARAGS